MHFKNEISINLEINNTLINNTLIMNTLIDFFIVFLTLHNFVAVRIHRIHNTGKVKYTFEVLFLKIKLILFLR